MPTSYTIRTSDTPTYTDRSAVSTDLGTRGVFLLTEASDHLLQEDGAKIILEHIPAPTYTERTAI